MRTRRPRATGDTQVRAYEAPGARHRNRLIPGPREPIRVLVLAHPDAAQLLAVGKMR